MPTILNPPRRSTRLGPIQTTGPCAIQSSERVLSEAEYQRVTGPETKPRPRRSWCGTKRLVLVDDDPAPMTIEEAVALTGANRNTVYMALSPTGRARTGGRVGGHRFVWANPATT